MKRGDVVLVRGGRGAAAKPRPCVVVQRSGSLPNAPKLTVCPLTSALHSENPIRPLVVSSPDNGLRRPSQVEADWIMTERIEHFGPVIGQVDDDTMLAVGRALTLWLDL